MESKSHSFCLTSHVIRLQQKTIFILRFAGWDSLSAPLRRDVVFRYTLFVTSLQYTLIKRAGCNRRWVFNKFTSILGI